MEMARSPLVLLFVILDFSILIMYKGTIPQLHKGFGAIISLLQK